MDVEFLLQCILLNKAKSIFYHKVSCFRIYLCLPEQMVNYDKNTNEIKKNCNVLLLNHEISVNGQQGRHDFSLR